MYESSDNICLPSILNKDQFESNFITATTIFGVFQPADAADNFAQTSQLILRTTKMWPGTIIFPWNDGVEHPDFKDADYCWWCEGYEYVNEPITGHRISPIHTSWGSGNGDGSWKNVQMQPLWLDSCIRYGQLAGDYDASRQLIGW